MDGYRDRGMHHRFSRRRVLSRAFGVLGALAMALSLTGASSAPKGLAVHQDGPALDTLDHAALIAAAQAEASLNVMALPRSWCNFGAVIDGFKAIYPEITVNEIAPEASSADELQAIRDGGPDAPDVIDVGPSFAVEAKAEGLLAPYEVEKWDEIPISMKDAEGFWYGDYYGLMSIVANPVSAPPSSWQDLLDDPDVLPVALGGDPRYSNKALFSVYAAALANGGSVDDIRPGVRFFKDLNAAGRLMSETANEDNLISGLTPVMPEWHYLAFAYRDAHPEVDLAIYTPELPEEGAIASFYAQAINASALHPNAARLWMEYLYSDEGQLAFLDGYCFPARYDAMLDAGMLTPPEGLPDPTDAAFPTVDQISAAQGYVEANWDCAVYGCPFVVDPAGWRGTEFWVGPSREIVLRTGWAACTRGLVTAYIKALDATYIWQDGQELQADWSEPVEEYSLSGSCPGKGHKGWVAYWQYSLGKLDAGDYTLHSTVALKHPVTDGYNPAGPGKPSFYPKGTLFDGDITIHVMPRFVASVVGDFLWTADFTAGAPLTISVYESAQDGEGQGDPWQGTFYADGSGFVSVTPEQGLPDLQAGNYATVDDGLTLKGLLLEAVSVDVFDTVHDVMSGTAPPYSRVWVAAGPQEWQTGMPVDTDSTGEWAADFKTLDPPFDIEEYMRPWSYAQLFDEDGDINEGDPPPPPNPHFTVFPEWEALELWEWPIDAVITLSIDDPATGEVSPDFEGSYTVPPAEWNPAESFLWIDIAGAYDVKAGDVVTITGEGFTVTHTVRALTVGALDVVENTISGTADPGAQVCVWPAEFGGWQAATCVGESEGTWTADLDDLGYDLVPGASGRAEIVDEIGNTTGVDWYASVPRIAAYPVQEFVIGWDWQPGSWLHLTIDDPATPAAPDFETDGQVVQAPFGPWWAMFDDLQGYDLKAGDLVTLTDWVTSREYTVLPLTVDVVDAEADSVAGTSAPGAKILVHPWDARFLPVETDADGNWLMNFAGLYDLQSGVTNGVAEVFEADGDSTAIDWPVP